MQIKNLTILIREDAIPAGMTVVFASVVGLAFASHIMHGGNALVAFGVVTGSLLGAVAWGFLLYATAVSRECKKRGGVAVRIPLVSGRAGKTRMLRCSDCGHLQRSPVQPAGRSADPHARRTTMGTLWDASRRDE